MNTKKEYISPELKVVEFKVEKGFAMSLQQRTGLLSSDDERSTYLGNNYNVNTNPFHVSFGSFGGNNEDWD